MAARRRRRQTAPLDGELPTGEAPSLWSAAPLLSRGRASLPPLSRSTLGFLGTIPRTASLDELKSLLERRGRESLRAADEKAHAVFRKARRRYLGHELLLLAFYQRRSPRERWIDPLARWRSAWRAFGTLALLSNALLFTSTAWVHWRCEVDPLCDAAAASCPHWAGMAPARELLLPIFSQLQRRQWPELPGGWMAGPGLACWRELGALISGMAVQGFSLAELALGIKTAALYRGLIGGGSAAAGVVGVRGIGSGRAGGGSPGGRVSPAIGAVVGGLVGDGGGGRRALHYGTSYGLLAWALVGLDVTLAVPWTLATDLLLLMPWRQERSPDTSPSSALRAREGGFLPRWSVPLHRWLRERRWFRTLVGWQRLAALPPAPFPVQWTLDTILVPAWLGRGREATKKLIRLLPTIGDAILEAELLQAFLASFFASAKALVLLASMLKATRVRRRLRAMRQQTAARLIVTCVRRVIARKRVRTLQQAHQVGASAAAALRERGNYSRQGAPGRTIPPGGSELAASISVPHELSAYLPHQLRSHAHSCP